MTTADRILLSTVLHALEQVMGELCLRGLADCPAYKAGLPVIADLRVRLAAPEPESVPAQEWRCFHCGEAFTDRTQAALHFGTHDRHSPACQIDVAEYRAMEARMERYNQEDADIHREMYGFYNKHAEALLREEEKGYARGVKDAMAEFASPQPNDDDKRDAERYRWLRQQHWNESSLCVVERPRNAVKLGHDCPSLGRLDAAIDSAIAAAAAGEKT